MKFKFLYQDVDVVSLADKGIVVRCFVCRNFDKVFMETGKLCDNIRVVLVRDCIYPVWFRYYLMPIHIIW